MANYKILFRKSVLKDLTKIPKTDVERIVSVVQDLSTNPRPHGCEKLSGREEYRIRQGDYRIVYSIQDKEVTVWIIKVGHRREVYR